MKVLLLSDTHGCTDQWMLKHAASADEIWHAGDWGDQSVPDQLRELAPLRGVYGNIDGNDIRTEFAEQLLFRIHGMTVAMIHIGGYPRRYRPKALSLIQAHHPDVVITGHSHILKVMNDPENNHLHLNPGAAGIKGFHQVRTMLTFKVTSPTESGKGKLTDLQVIEHPKRIVS